MSGATATDAAAFPSISRRFNLRLLASLLTRASTEMSIYLDRKRLQPSSQAERQDEPGFLLSSS